MTISNYAIVESGVVTNTVVWDGQSEWTPPTGSIAVLIPDGVFVSIGSTYNGTSFSMPPTPT